MHFYQIPDPSSMSEPELVTLRSLADEFDRATLKPFSAPAKIRAIQLAADFEEVATMQGMMALIKTPNADGNVVELGISLQILDIQAGLMHRADPALAVSLVPTAMATEAAADLFRKYDLPQLEDLSRKAIKPPTP